MPIRFPCSICGCEMGWARPSGVCSEACLRAGQGGEPLPPMDAEWSKDYAGFANEQVDQHNEQSLRQLLALDDDELEAKGVTRLGITAALERFAK